MKREEPGIAAVTILDREYRVVCTEDGREALSNAASLLDERLRKVRDSGRINGLDRIAVLVALNLASELLQTQAENSLYVEALGAEMQRIQDKITDALLDAPSVRE